MKRTLALALIAFFATGCIVVRGHDNGRHVGGAAAGAATSR